jgi:hypothetical protein
LVDHEGNVSSTPFPDGRAHKRVYPFLPGHTESQAMAKLYERVYNLIVLSEEISTPSTRAALLDLCRHLHVGEDLRQLRAGDRVAARREGSARKRLVLSQAPPEEGATRLPGYPHQPEVCLALPPRPLTVTVTLSRSPARVSAVPSGK